MVNKRCYYGTAKADAINTQLSYALKVSQIKSAPHFVEMVMSDLYKKYDEETLTRSGFQITSLDLNIAEASTMVSITCDQSGF